MSQQLRSAMLKIEEGQADYARKISAQMSEPLARKKGLVDIIGITCAADYFSQCGYNVTTSRCLHKIPAVYEEFKISDIYVNNYRLDVITLFRTNDIFVPRAHTAYDCAPDYYIVVQVGPRIKDAKVLGYFKPLDVSFVKGDEEYISVDEKCLKSIDGFKKLLMTPASPRQIQGKHLDCMSLFLRFIDKELATTYKKLMIGHLVTCPACTKRLADVLDFNDAMKDLPKNIDVMQKYASKPKHTIEDNLEFVKNEPVLKEEPVYNDNEYEAIKNSLTDEEQKTFKNIIDGIFDSVPKFDPSKGVSAIGGRQKRAIVIFACICIFFFISTIIVMKSSTSHISSISDVDSSYSQDGDYSDAQADFTSSHNLPQEVYSSQSQGVDYSLATEAAGEPVVATINKISWEVPENIANRANYKRFLQLVGKNIKLNLQNDLLLSNDFAKNNIIKLNIRIASNGDIIGTKIVQSSGSGAIDEIIKKSVSETLSYMKPPSHGLIARPVDITLVINL